MVCSGLMTTHRRRCRPKVANSISLFPADLTTQDAYFEPTVGILPNWIKGWNFSQCRQDCPLPPPINRGGFQGLKEKKIGSKVGQKTSHFPQFCNFSLFPLPLSLSTVAFGHHHSYHRRFIIVSTTSGRLNSSPTVHQVATVALSLSLSPLQTFFFFLHQLNPAIIPLANASWATSRITSSRSRPPRQTTFSSLLRLFIPLRGWCMQNSFLHTMTN